MNEYDFLCFEDWVPLLSADLRVFTFEGTWEIHASWNAGDLATGLSLAPSRSWKASSLEGRLSPSFMQSCDVTGSEGVAVQAHCTSFECH